MSADESTDVSRLLRAWHVDTLPNPGFNDRVWRRLAQAQSLEPGVAWIAGTLSLAALWLRPLNRPSVAGLCLGVLLLTGGAVGWWQGQTHARSLDAELARLYVQSVSPPPDHGPVHP